MRSWISVPTDNPFFSDGRPPGPRVEVYACLTCKDIKWVIDPSKPIAHAIAAIRDLISARHGMLTITGLPGRGKSTLLHALVIELRLLNIAAACTTTTVLLNHLREGFSRPGEYDRRWRDICTLPALAIDDLDRFKHTDWSAERLTSLIDLRSQTRNRTITAVTLDTQVGQLLSQTTLPERIVRRLTKPDALVVTVYGGEG